MCEPRAAIEVVSLISVAVLAAVLMVISVLATWDDMAYAGCLSILFLPFMWWLILCVLLAPIGGVLEAYIIRFAGQETQARVIDHYYSSGVRRIHEHYIEYTYDVPINNTTCTVMRENVAVTKDTFERYTTGSSITIRYLSYNPFISQPVRNEYVAIEVLWYVYGIPAFVGLVFACIDRVKKHSLNQKHDIGKA